MKSISLRDARRRAGLTQTELAARLDKPQSFISKLENGLSPEPSFSDVVTMARACGVDPFALRFDRAERVA